MPIEYDIYISGKMTGLPDFNRSRFNQVADLLINEGYTVFNPASIVGEDDWDWSKYMRVALQGQMKSKSILMLIGYESSKGACIELKLARELGMTITYEHNLYSSVKPIHFPKNNTTKRAQ